MLFVPGNSAKKLGGMFRYAADGFILDLEDSVPESEKASARDRVREVVRAHCGEAQLFVRTGPVRSEQFEMDIRAVVCPGLAGVTIPKVRDAADISLADGLLGECERTVGIPSGRTMLMATIESAVGARNVYEIAAEGDRRRVLCFGAADFAFDLGLERDVAAPVPATVLLAKANLVLASRVAGLAAPHDSAYPAYKDDAGLRREAAESRAMGFAGKHAIHPRQLSIIESVYRPTASQVAAAQRDIEAFERARRGGVGAISVDGQLVDAAHFEHAKEVLREAWLQ
jgi:citrate lyase beta subunit